MSRTQMREAYACGGKGFGEGGRLFMSYATGVNV